MKKIFRLIEIIALAAVIGFSMTACGEEDDSPKSQSDFDIIEAIVYGNGKFVTICNGKIATSTDGIKWTKQKW